MNADYELALFKDGNKILALLKNNETIYVNPGNKKDKEKNKKHFQMLFTNGSYFQIIFKSGSSAYIQGRYVVRYYINGRMPPEDPEPLSFSIEINTTAEANTVSTQGINEEHPQHVLTGLPSPKIPPTPTTGLQARKTQMHVPWEILVLAVTVVVLVVIFASIKLLWNRNSD
ncbi:unnamed protein product [Porites evermanni]|uniref:Uncharacterized protein n=1 Tax=Porites evermanni TaxID=104178 RepID=A0ABN8SSV7_9CNID|nr:unnamed protein product [Porites evermanni]